MFRTVALISVLVACGSSSSSSPDAKGTGSGSGSGSGSGGLQLTVKNYLSWCSVAVGTGATSTDPMQVVSETAGTVNLVATAAGSAFEIGGNMWHFVDGDASGSGVTGTVSGTMSTAQVTISTASKCVWVCCPFANGTGCTGIADQCP
jgi:hypothetical protein